MIIIKKIRNTALCIIFILILAASTFVGYSFKNSIKQPPIIDDDNTPSDIIEEYQNPIQTYKLSLIATGDALLHPPVYRAGYDDATKSYDFSNMLKYTQEKIANYDIRYFNQETVFDDDKQYSGYPTFNSPSLWGQSMIDIGFNMVSLATNHSMDMGNNSAKKSAAWWESKDDILTSGMASSQEMRNNYKIMEKNGITYTMLSYTYGTNGIPTLDDYTVNLYDEEIVLKDIEAVRDKVDVLIVAMHWGTEYYLDATETQKAQANFLANHGVDIVLGNHSHCIEPWEKIGDTVVFYSFGNFISNQMTVEQSNIRKVGPIGMFGTLDITKTVDSESETSKITIDNIGAELTYTYRYYNNEKGKYDYQVIPFSKINSTYLSNYKKVYEEFTNILTKYDKNINIVPLEE